MQPGSWSQDSRTKVQAPYRRSYSSSPTFFFMANCLSKFKLKLSFYLFPELLLPLPMGRIKMYHWNQWPRGNERPHGAKPAVPFWPPPFWNACWYWVIRLRKQLDHLRGLLPPIPTLRGIQTRVKWLTWSNVIPKFYDCSRIYFTPFWFLSQRIPWFLQNFFSL